MLSKVTCVCVVLLAAGAAEVGEALVADHTAGKVDQDRSEGSNPLRLRNHPHGKVDICHLDQETGAFHAINISQNAMRGHLNHGDCVINDGVDCTVDSCDPEEGCVHDPDDDLCGNGDLCDGEETCDPDDGCRPGTPLDVDDGNVCTDDSCDPFIGGIHVPNNDPCDDGVFCTAGDTCSDGLCIGGPPTDCDDGVACTIDSCDQVSDRCVNDPDDSSCDNGLFCDGAETCDPFVGCAPGNDPCPGRLCDEDANQCDELRVLATDVSGGPECMLLEVDPATAGTTLIGPISDRVVASLTWDANHRVLYASSTTSEQLLQIDPDSGAHVVIGPLGIDLMHSIEYDPIHDVLYGASWSPQALFRIDTGTGHAELVAALSQQPRGLAFDATTGTMYMGALSGLYRLNLSSGGL